MAPFWTFRRTSSNFFLPEILYLIHSRLMNCDHATFCSIELCNLNVCPAVKAHTRPAQIAASFGAMRMTSVCANTRCCCVTERLPARLPFTSEGQGSGARLLEATRTYSLLTPPAGPVYTAVSINVKFTLVSVLVALWSRDRPEKLIVPRLVKKFPAFYGTGMFMTVLTTAQHLPLSSARSVQSIPFHTVNFKIHSDITLPSTPKSSKLSLSFSLYEYFSSPTYVPHVLPISSSFV